MSYNDDEELKIGEFEEPEDDALLEDVEIDEPLSLDDDFAEPLDEEEEDLEEFADLDGSEY